MAAPFENPADFSLWARSLAAATRQILSISVLAALCLSQTTDAHLAERTPAQILGAFRLTPGRLPGVAHASFPTPPALLEGARRRALIRAHRMGRRSAVLIDLAFGATIQGVLRSRSAASSGQDPRRACELSALYLGLSAEGDEPLRHAARALTWAEAALRHQPDRVEALFNRALALERLSLKKDAAAAWERYLAIDAKSPWAEEARQRHRRLIETVSPEKKWQEARRELETAPPARVAEIVQEHAQPGRLWVERTLLPGWARSHRNHDPPETAARWIDQALVVATALARETGDLLPLDSVQVIRRAQQSRDTARLALLAEGHSTLVEAMVQHESGIGCREEETFRRSEGRLLEAGSPMALWATFYRANCSYRRREYGQARERLRELLAHCRPDRHRTVCGRALWLKGLMDFHENQPGEAFAAYSEAGRLLAKEKPFLATVHILEAEVHLLLGERVRAWESLDASLQNLETLAAAESLRRQGIFQGAALMSAAERDFSAALRFEAAALENAQASPGSLDDALLLRERAEIHYRAGDIEAASADLRQAEAALDGMEGRAAKTVRAEVQTLRAQLFPHALSAEDWAARVRVLEETSNRIVLPRALLFLGRAHAREQDLRAAEGAWQHGLEELEKIQPSLAGRQKSGYFERRDNLLAELLPVQIRLDPRGTRAFHTVERARRRSSLRQTSQVDDVTCDQLQKALPPGHVLLEYAVLPDRLLIWVIGRERTVFRSVPLSQQQLTAHLRGLPRAGERELEKLLGELYAVLFAPVREAIPVGSTLLIVPDWHLYAVPFAALRDPARNRFLVDDYVLTGLPDARSLLRSGLREQPSRPLRSLLVLGDPAFPTDQHPTLRPLDGAGKEAGAIWHLYDPALSRLRLQEQATPSEFLQGLGRYDVVHYGGHGVATSPDPALARLIFAPEAGRSSDLAAHELYDRDFSGTRLVVLAACETAAARAWAPRVGLEGFVEPLLEGGVRNVLASLWKIEDDAARQQVLAFHRELRRSGDPLQALAEVQRRGRREGQPIRRWAGLALFGSAF